MWCKMNNKIIIWMIGFLLLVPIVYSLGLTTPFLGEHVEVFRGEKLVVTFMLQNMVGGKNYNVKVEMLEGKEIAKVLEEGTIRVPYGRNDIPINVELNIPQDAKDEYLVSFSIKTLASPDVRQVQLATGIEKRFKVKVSDGSRPVTAPTPSTTPVPQPKLEEPAEVKKNRQTVILAIFLVIVIIILYKWVRRHKEKYDIKRLKDEFSF